MGKNATNIAIVLGIITIAFAGYYLYTQRDSTTLSIDTNDQQLEDMLQQSRVFIDRQQTLSQIEMDLSMFEDPRFNTLREFTKPINERPIGRPNPFAEPVTSVSGQ